MSAAEILAELQTLQTVSGFEFWRRLLLLLDEMERQRTRPADSSGTK